MSGAASAAASGSAPAATGAAAAATAPAAGAGAAKPTVKLSALSKKSAFAKEFVPSFGAKPAAAAAPAAAPAAAAPAAAAGGGAAAGASAAPAQSAPVGGGIDPNAPVYAMDIECVATGAGHNDRAVAQIAVVDSSEKVVCNLYVKPAAAVKSYLPALTSLDAAKVDGGMTLDAARAAVRKVLPANAVLVGQNILKDVQWLELAEGKDFGAMQDLGGLWRVWNPQFNSFSAFSLSHECKQLLGYAQPEPHDAVSDSVVSVRLYALYKQLSAKKDGGAALDAAKHKLLAAKPESSFAARFPTYEGVCMGNKRACQCGQPFMF